MNPLPRVPGAPCDVRGTRHRASHAAPSPAHRSAPHGLRFASLLAPLFGVVLFGACATLGGPRDIPMRTVALRADPGATPAAVAGALDAAGARAAFVASTGDTAWFRDVAAATGLHLSGPATMGDLRMAFLAPEPVGDTTHQLDYDGGMFTIQDALYEIEKDRLLDLIAFRIEEGAPVRAVIGALLEYVATDVDNAAALVMAVAVPSAAVGDTVARMLAPAYYDALRCEADAAAPSAGERIRLFYGPEARMYCADAAAERGPEGDWVRAELIMGRR